MNVFILNAGRSGLDYCDTIYSNIELFLRDKPHKMDFAIENARLDFRQFLELIKAEGDLDAALLEFDEHYNASGHTAMNLARKLGGYVRRLLGLSTEP